MVSPRFMKSLDTFEVRSDDIFISSYPRSGTTWTEEVVSSIVSKFDPKFMSKQVHDRVIHLEVGRPFGQKSHLKSLKSPRLLGTHLPINYCPLKLQQLKCKVIQIIFIVVVNLTTINLYPRLFTWSGIPKTKRCHITISMKLQSTLVAWNGIGMSLFNCI